MLANGTGTGIAGSQRLRWRRNLYEKTGLPDNYAPDDCFLAAIRRNRDVCRYRFGQCAPMACLVSLQVSAAVAFYAAYSALSGRMAKPDTILALGGAAAAVGYLAGAVCGKRSLTASVLLVDLKHLVVFSSFGIGLSPVLYRFGSYFENTAFFWI